MIWCMQRTNIYLEDRQTAALDEVARGRAITRAELVRQYIDRGLTEDAADVDAAVRAIEASFGVLPSDAQSDADGTPDAAVQQTDMPDRSRTERDAHLQRLWAR